MDADEIKIEAANSSIWLDKCAPAAIYNQANVVTAMTTYCLVRILGSVPPPGFPLLVDDDAAPNETPARIMGQRIRKRVSHFRQNVLNDEETANSLKQKLEEGYTLRELATWAEQDVQNQEDKKKLTKTISVAIKLNDKSLLRSVLLPCENVLFLGIVSDFQPPPPISATHGLNHVNIIVEGRLGTIPEMFTREGPARREDPVGRAPPEKEEYYDSGVLDGHISVLGEPVGIIVNGQRILTNSGIRLRMPVYRRG